jgi:hypothetical protein
LIHWLVGLFLCLVVWLFVCLFGWLDGWMSDDGGGGDGDGDDDDDDHDHDHVDAIFDFPEMRIHVVLGRIQSQKTI